MRYVIKVITNFDDIKFINYYSGGGLAYSKEPVLVSEFNIHKAMKFDSYNAAEARMKLIADANSTYEIVEFDE